MGIGLPSRNHLIRLGVSPLQPNLCNFKQAMSLRFNVKTPERVCEF